MLERKNIRKILSIVDGALIILFFVVTFSFALALVLWLVGILGVSIWSVAKIFLVMVMICVLESLLVRLINMLEV
nr:MAG TPA: hypothetical protein [Caudoviricetes sp.]